MKKLFTSAMSLLVAATGWVAYAAAPDNGVYEIKHNDRGYLTQNVEASTIHPGDATLGGFTTSDKCVVGRTENGYNPYWYLYTSEKTGSSYIFSAVNGKFLAYDNGTASGESASLLNLSDTPAPFDITESTEAGMYEIHAKGVTVTAFSNSIGWGINVTYRFANIFTDYDGVAHAFIAATVENNEEVINAGIAKIVAKETIDTYTEYFTNAKTTYAENADIVAIADEALALIATIDPLVEIPAETIEALEGYKAAIELKVLIAQKKAQIEVYFAASQEPSFYMDMLGQFDWCETAEEVEATYFDLLNTATMFMESSLELGCLWKNNETGLYVAAQTVATGGAQYRFESEMSLNAYWMAEFIEDGNGGIAPANEDEQLPESGEEEGETDEEPVVETRKFYLRNVLTNTYAANNSTNLGVIHPTTDKNYAAVIELVIAPNGYKFIVTNDNVENNFIGGGTEGTAPAILQEAENALTYWSVPSLPMFNGTTQYIEMNFIGEYTEGDYTIDWHKINGVEIKVSKGATPTAIGNLTISHLDMTTWEQVTDAQFDMTTLLEGVTPTSEVIEDYDAGYFDPTIGEWGEWVENLIDLELDVYTVNFETPLTAYEYFTAVLSAGAFALTVDDETAYSFESYAEAEIKAPPMPFDVVITPVEGTVVELTEINVGCDKAIYANWEGWEAMTLVANGETTLFELYAGNMSDFAWWDLDDPDAPQFKIPVADAITLYYNKLIENAAEGEEITVPTYNPAGVGTYVLTVPTGFFTDDAENESNPLTVTWTIEETDGINTITNVTVNGNVIYDLQGRRVANPNKGIYIINGKKTLVK